MKILIAGSSGLIGSRVVADLEANGHDVVRLVRAESPTKGLIWDPTSGALPDDALSGVDVVINLAGRSIGEKRWSSKEKQALWDSRVTPTAVLARAIARCEAPPALINASAVGIYGDGGQEPITERSPSGEGFLAELCVAWEAATKPAAEAGARVVLLRTGIVVSDRGGAIGRLLAPFGPRWLSPYRWGLGGVVGRGRQWWSWISLDDEVAAIRHLVESDIAGPVNLVAGTVTHRSFIKSLGKALRRPTVMPIPPFVIKILLGSELARALVLDGQRVVSTRLTDSGFIPDDDLDGVLRSSLGD